MTGRLLRLEYKAHDEIEQSQIKSHEGEPRRLFLVSGHQSRVAIIPKMTCGVMTVA